MSTALAGEQMSNPSNHEQAIQRSSSGMSNGGGVHLSRGSGTGTYDPDRPPLPRTGGASANSGARKMRRIIDDDDDDDDTPIFAPPPQQQARASSMSASRPGSGPSKHGSNSSHGARGGMNGGRSGDRPQSEKKRIIPGPPKAKTAAGTSSQKSGSAGSKRVHDDDEEEAEMDLSFGATHKKTSRDTGGGAGSSRGAQKLPSKNGVRKEASSFKIPKREGASPRPVPASGSPRSGGSGSYGRSSSSSGASGMRKSGHADSGYEPRPSKDLNKKRPDDSRRESGNKGPHREDPAKANDIRKRKLEMEQRLLEEERRKKKKMEAASGKGSASNLKSKVKAEPVRRVSSSSSGKGRAQRPKTAAAAASSAAAPRAPERKFKEKTRKDKIEEAMKVYKWWEEPSLEHGKQWESLEHNGAHFAPEYKPHGVKLKYDGEDVYLTPQQEEIATFYASMPLDGPQLTEQASVFNKNFFEDFKAVLGRGHKIKKFELLDFSAMRRHLDTVKQIKRAATDGEKAVAKTEKEELKHKYCYSIVDGHLEMVGNFSVEPPGLFRGRGKHPKTGKVKARVMPSDIALNCGESVCVPRCSVPGYAWQNVQHDPSVTWLGKWDGNLAGTKYMMLAASSSFKGKSDMAKYNKAMALKGNIDKIRKDYTKKLNSANAQTKQIATAVWIIDILALRVGGEKGDDEADTVGCCSLRREHITFNEDSSVHEIDLEFLGKDSMLFKQTIDFDKYGEVGTKVFHNLQAFCKNKRQSQEVFDRLDPSILNQHLQSLMPGLTAKVFRTYNASETLQTQLPEEEALKGLSVPEKVALYNGANREVAILCNHQRTVSSAQKEGLEKMQGRLEMLKRQKKELKMMLQQVTQKKSVRLKSSDKSAETKCQRAQEEAKAAKAKAKTNEEKIAAVNAATKAAELKKALQQSKAEESHLFSKTPSVESLKGRIENWANRIKKLEIDLRNKDDNKEVSLTTSKINYMDPRVSVAWCKRHEVPVEKVFAATLQAKFVWAMNVPPDWEFSHLTLPQFQGKGKGASKASATKTAPKTAAPAAPAAKVKTEVKKEEVEEDDEDDDDEEDSDDDEGGDDGGGDSDEDDDEEGDDDEEDDDDDDEEEGEDDDEGDSDFGS